MVVDNSLGGLVLDRKIKTEYGLIACLMSDPVGMFQNFSWIPGDSFSDPKVRGIWESWIRHNGDLDKAVVEVDPDYKTISLVSSQTSSQTNTTRPDVYVERLEKLNYMGNAVRILQRAATQIGQEKIDEAMATLEKLIEAGLSDDKEIKNPEKIHTEFVDQINQGFDGVSTGIYKIDYTIGRLLKGHLSVVASRTSVGKTAWVWDIACRVAADRNNSRKVLYFSTESSAIDLWVRRAAGRSGVNWRTIVSGGGTAEEKDRIINTSQELKAEYGNQLIIDDQHDTLSEIQRVTSREKPDLIIVDHLDEIQVDSSISSKSNVEINKVVLLAESVRVLRRLGKRFNAHVMVVHQLSRALESREDHEPTLADLRWSGDIEQKADIVFLLHRPDLYDDTDKSKLTEVPVRIKIAKNRLGARDVVATVMYNLVKQEFYEKREIGY